MRVSAQYEAALRRGTPLITFCNAALYHGPPHAARRTVRARFASPARMRARRFKRTLLHDQAPHQPQLNIQMLGMSKSHLVS